MAARKTSKVATRKGSNATAAALVTPEPAERTDDLGELVRLPIEQIDPDSFQNCRTAGWESAKSTGTKDEGATFEELMASIEATGQKDPVTVRPKPGKGNKVPYELVKGFRRFKAVRMLAEKQGLKNPTVKVIIKNLSDLEAHEENVFENTARDNLSSYDLAFAASNLLMRYQAAGVPMSVNQLAQRMGKNQSYLNQLVTIVAKDSTLAEKWRKEPVVIPVQTMYNISQIADKAERDAAYESAKTGKAIKGQSNSGGTGSRNQPTDTQRAKNLAERMGNLLGRMQASGLIATGKLVWNRISLQVMGADVKNVSDADLLEVAKAGQEAFKKAVEAVKAAQKAAKVKPAGESEESEESEETADA